MTVESRYLWDVYHSDGITRDVYFQMLGERTEADTFQCLAWLYEGFAGRPPAGSPAPCGRITSRNRGLSTSVHSRFYWYQRE